MFDYVHSDKTRVGKKTRRNRVFSIDASSVRFKLQIKFWSRRVSLNNQAKRLKKKKRLGKLKINTDTEHITVTRKKNKV